MSGILQEQNATIELWYFTTKMCLIFQNMLQIKHGNKIVMQKNLKPEWQIPMLKFKIKQTKSKTL